jgi:hypothetical protein
MAVVTTLTLPSQPTTGSVVYKPLGGNGFTSPQSMFYVTVDSLGIAGGGLNSIQVFKDERFEQLVDFMTIQGNAGAVIYRMDIFRDLGSRALVIDTTSADTTISCGTWSPPALIDPESWKVSTANVEDENVKLKMAIYNFNIRASEKIPLELLLASIRRAATVI